MKYIKSFEAMGTLQPEDMEIITDILLDFKEKWDLNFYINEPTLNLSYIQLRRFSPFFIEMKVSKAKRKRYETKIMTDSQLKELEGDLYSAIERLKKFGYEIQETTDTDNYSTYDYYFLISHTEEKSSSLL